MAKTKNTANPGNWAKELAAKKTELQALGFKSAGSKLTNVKAARNLRRDIARLLTVAKINANQATK